MPIKQTLGCALAVMLLAGGAARAAEDEPASALAPPEWRGCKTDPRSRITGPAAAIACRSEAPKIIADAWWHEERGDDGPVTRAAVVASCARMIGPRNWNYLGYRLCRIAAEQVDEPRLTAALDEQGIADPERGTILARYAEGKQTIDGLAARAAEHERGYPGDRAYFDDSLAQTRQLYQERFAHWLPRIDELGAWGASLAGGPGFAEGCRARTGKLLDEYLRSAVPKAKGTHLLEALRDPIGFHLTEARGVCDAELRDEWHARVFAEEYLGHARRVVGWHDALWYVLAANAWPDAKWKNKALSSDRVNRIEAAPNETDDKLWRYLARYSANGQTDEDVVDSVKRQGDHVVVTFKKTNGSQLNTVGCKPDYSHVSSIDANGGFHYDQRGCRTVEDKFVKQTHPVSLPADEAVAVKPGTRIRVLRVLSDPWDEKKPSSVVLVWVKRGPDVVWAGGYAAP
jgi:hypothetical protein